MNTISYALLFLTVTVTVVQAADTCWSNADCNGGCCVKTSGGNVCQRLAKVNEICDLEGKGLAEMACNCEPGLSCEKIDLGMWGAEAASANPILEQHHYGWCEVSGGVVG